VGHEHVHAATYFATRILYQRGKLDLPGVVARLDDLLRACPDFPEAEAMLGAAKRGTLRPDARGFIEATVPPAPAPRAEAQPEPGAEADDGDRATVPSNIPRVESRIQTPQAPGIPRAPLLPRFTPPENAAPSYAPKAVPSLRELELDAATPPQRRATGSQPRIATPPAIAVEIGPFDGVVATARLARSTAPSPGAAGPSAAAPPTVFAIATWLSERDFERALAAIERLGADSSPELSLLEVRALVGLGRKAAGRRSLERLSRAPLLDPDLRAAVARLLIELGDLDRAEAQARRAYAEDPGSELSRLTLSWAVARRDAWLLAPRSALELAELLRDFTPEASALPALGYALTALMLLHTSPEAAQKSVSAALALEPDSQDALAVAAVIAHRQRRTSDVEVLRLRLFDIDHSAAEELSATLASLDRDAARPPEKSSPLAADRSSPFSTDKSSPLAADRSSPFSTDKSSPLAADRSSPFSTDKSSPLAADRSSPFATGQSSPFASTRAALTAPPGSRAPLAAPSSPWDEKEQRLALGDSRAALFEFEQGLSRKLEALSSRATPSELSSAALTTARYLTEATVSRHFAPFDLSLFSIARLDVALGLLYRGGVGPRTELRTRALMGLGAYLGECLRQAYAGEWLGQGADLLLMQVEGQGLHFTPFSDMNARMQSAEPLEVKDARLPHPGAEPLGQRVALSISPPTPWDPVPWPDVSRLPELGATLRQSPVGLYCAGIEVPLDLSFASLRSLDRYVTLLAPPLAPSDPEAAWVKRAAVLVGAYMGEVLRATRGGSWEPTRGELRADSYRFALPSGTKALPVASAFERLSGRRLEQPSDYARRITG
jgi:tetratricopeptide (TPR) repeat protein